jgi:HlyD family secretion protein
MRRLNLPRPRASRLQLVLAVAGLAGLLLVALGGGAGRAAGDTAAPAPPPQGVAARGRLEPLGGIVRIGAPSMPDAVSGAALARLHVDYGSDVTAGQLLAELDTGAIVAARLDESRADLETARRESIAASSLAEEACVLADVAARQARRKTELLGRGLASDEEAERARGDSEAGAASCAARRAAARVAESAIASAEARIARHKAELERAFIRAPFDGRVLDVLARPGEIVGLEGILELGRVGAMCAIAEVYETDVRNLKVGMRARVTSPALAAPLAGKVQRVRPKVQKMDEIGTDPAARKDARIVEVEILLDDSAAAANLTNLQVDVEIGR